MWLMLVVWVVGCTAIGTAESEDTATSGEIRVYTNLLEDQYTAYLPAFRERYPDIDVDVLRESTGDLTNRLLRERDEPKADVIWGLSATNMVLLEWNNVLMPYAPAGLERVQLPFRDTNNPPYWVGFDAWMSAFCVNSEELAKLDLPVPTHWADLTREDYAGRIALPSPTSSGTGYMTLVAIIEIFGETKGWEYLDALHENVTEYTVFGGGPCQLVAEGAVPIGVSFGLGGLSRKSEGAPIDVIFPAEGSGWDMEANALIRKDEIKEAAKTFLDWAISDAAMEQYAQNYAVTAVPLDIPVREGYPSDPSAQLLDKDFPWASSNRERILEEWVSRYGDKLAEE